MARESVVILDCAWSKQMFGGNKKERKNHAQNSYIGPPTGLQPWTHLLEHFVCPPHNVDSNELLHGQNWFT